MRAEPMMPPCSSRMVYCMVCGGRGSTASQQRHTSWRTQPAHWHPGAAPASAGACISAAQRSLRAPCSSNSAWCVRPPPPPHHKAVVVRLKALAGLDAGGDGQHGTDVRKAPSLRATYVGCRPLGAVRRARGAWQA
jgi:hypothetical protein